MDEPIYTKEEAKNLSHSMNECGVLTSTEPHLNPEIPNWLALCIGDMSIGDDRWVIIPQMWACLLPEDPGDRVLYHGNCDKCMVKLQADSPNTIFMRHGSSYRYRIERVR